jgi:ABC-type transport system involved in multi-copper enzyme maturation permease subunit
MTSLFQLWRITCYEWFTAMRSRRAVVVVLLFMAASVCTMNFCINALQKMEQELTKVLDLPETEQVGVVSKTLWQSKPFRRMMRHIVYNKDVYNDLVGRHPVELMYAWLVFFYTPLLVVLVSANRIADELGSGACRYVAFRCSRSLWSAGKYFGQAAIIAIALMLSGIGAWLMASIRMHEAGWPLLIAITGWSIRSLIYALPFLGLSLGLSHLTRSGSKATIFAIMTLALCFLIEALAVVFRNANDWKALFNYAGVFTPAAHKFFLWRSTPLSLAIGTLWMITLSLCYLIPGHLIFKYRDM